MIHGSCRAVTLVLQILSAADHRISPRQKSFSDSIFLHLENGAHRLRLTLSISGGASAVHCMLLIGAMPRISLFWRGHAGGKGREGGVASVSRFPSGSCT